jgi:bifunctional UDP-N-acetylglucosamine pyrophosphorylase/glucosamine-1-phosphate N-acetyltransferase
MEAMLKEHKEKDAKATILTAVADDPAGYGRIIRSESGAVQKIVEHKDASDQERLVKEINTGTYCFDNEALFRVIEQVSNDNVQGEYYLPDVIEILKNEGETVAAYQTGNFQETLGVNDRVALSQAELFMKQRINKRHMQNGVSLIDPMNTYISPEAVIGSDTVIYPGTVIKGQVQIGEDSIIGPHSEIENSSIGSRTVIKQSVVNNSKVGNDVNIGPFAHIRPESTIGNEVKIGNFVEVKKTQFGDRSKASHLSYVGDAEVGADVNLGCGSITVNYDGKNKFLTKIEDGAFIGCNSNLVAPVTVGKGAYVAAGSTVTEDVPGKALAIARARQVNKDDYVKKIHKKQS